MTTSRIQELFYYNDGKLYWKQKQSCAQNLSKEAGSVCNRRRYIQIEGKKYLAHRLIYMLHFGYCPEFLDHIDNDPFNNRIENLRPATKQQNAQNRLIHACNKTGYKGVHKQRKKFIASICVSGCTLYLGSYTDPQQAHAVYVAAAIHHFKEFANV